MIKEIESHEARSHWTLTENIEVKNKHKNKYSKLKTIYPFGISSARDYRMGS